MKNKKLSALSASLCVLLCLCAVPSVCAIEPLELNVENVAVVSGGLTVYCNTNTEDFPRKEYFTATLGNTALPVDGVTTVADGGDGTSYIFLADVSGSIKAPHFQAIKDTIALICENLTEQDNISVFAIGDKTYTQPFVSGAEDIQAQIDAIERSREDTNLYESVFTALGVLNTHADCRGKKALVIFSDGEEDIFEGITIDEAEIKIRDSHIPIYTVAMLGKNPSGKYVETAKILGSFARLSPGGRHYIHNLERDVSENIASGVIDAIQNGLIVSLNLAEFRSNGEDMALRLELNVPGAGTASDGYAIPTGGLSAPEPEPSPFPSEPPSPAPPSVSPSTPTPPPPTPDIVEKTPFLKENLMWIIIGGAALLLVTAVVVFLVLRRKNPGSPASVPAPAAPTPVKAARPALPSPPPGKPRISLRLTKIGLSEKQVFRAEFAGELVIGRDAAKAALSFQNDEMLSGRHCAISYEADGIVLRDLGSTNRTFVNGVPIQSRYILENDDVLLVGSMELRVNWEEI